MQIKASKGITLFKLTQFERRQLEGAAETVEMFRKFDKSMDLDEVLGQISPSNELRFGGSDESEDNDTDGDEFVADVEDAIAKDGDAEVVNPTGKASDAEDVAEARRKARVKKAKATE